MSDVLAVSDEVAAALRAGAAVVALETTLVTHGLPQPEGVETASAMLRAVREQGAVPALIGVLDGRAWVGLSGPQLERLAADGAAEKLNPGNLAARLAAGGPGATTVAATLIVAQRAGIRVFATGGIGGVHRDASESGDVSADLTWLGRVPVAVVCSGAKAILDLARTREALETLGVPVYGFGTDTFPAFYRRDSGLPVDARFDAVEPLAAAVRAHFELCGAGVLVANPIAAEHELPLELYDASLERALAAAREAGVRGRALTPFLLERLRQLTDGRSVFSNRSLLLGNARLAGALAVALARLPA
jgi:pseudouridine-5'-phosphate glycosidase